MRETSGAGSAQPVRDRVGAARGWWPALAVVGLLGLAAGAAALSSPRVTHLRTPDGSSGPIPTSLGTEPVNQGEVAGDGGRRALVTLPDWVVELALYLCLAVAVTAIGALVWAVVRDRIAIRKGVLRVERGAAPSRQRTDDVVAALDAGLDELSDIDADPRRAVIACWVRLEHAAAAAGTPRRVGDTSTDLVLRLLGAHRVDRGVLDRFASTYREARYATHTVDERMRSAAVSALRQLRGELTAAVAAP